MTNKRNTYIEYEENDMSPFTEALKADIEASDVGRVKVRNRVGGARYVSLWLNGEGSFLGFKSDGSPTNLYYPCGRHTHNSDLDLMVRVNNS